MDLPLPKTKIFEDYHPVVTTYKNRVHGQSVGEVRYSQMGLKRYTLRRNKEGDPSIKDTGFPSHRDNSFGRFWRDYYPIVKHESRRTGTSSMKKFQIKGIVITQIKITYKLSRRHRSLNRFSRYKLRKRRSKGFVVLIDNIYQRKHLS